MVNPAIFMKLMTAKNKFTSAHPKFASFLQAMASQGIQEGCVIDITITRPDGRVIAGNMRVTESDMELLEDLKSISNMQ